MTEIWDDPCKQARWTGTNSARMFSLQSLTSFLSPLIFFDSRWEKIMAMGKCSTKENIFSMITLFIYAELF